MDVVVGQPGLIDVFQLQNMVASTSECGATVPEGVVEWLVSFLQVGLISLSRLPAPAVCLDSSERASHP